MPAWGFASRAARTKTAKHTRESLIPPPRVIPVDSAAAFALPRGFSPKFMYFLFFRFYQILSHLFLPTLYLLRRRFIKLKNLFFYAKDYAPSIDSVLLRSSIRFVYTLIAHVCFRERLRSLRVCRNCNMRYRIVLCNVLHDEARTFVFTRFYPYGGDYLTRRIIADRIAICHRGDGGLFLRCDRVYSFFFPPSRSFDTSTYVYARERMRANNGPACI